MRERVLAELEHEGGQLSHSIFDGDTERDIDDACERLESVIAAYRVLKANAEAYPVDVVELAAQLVIEDAASRIDDAEAAITLVRATETLRATIDQQAVTA